MYKFILTWWKLLLIKFQSNTFIHMAFTKECSLQKDKIIGKVHRHKLRNCFTIWVFKMEISVSMNLSTRSKIDNIQHLNIQYDAFMNLFLKVRGPEL